MQVVFKDGFHKGIILFGKAKDRGKLKLPDVWIKK